MICRHGNIKLSEQCQYVILILIDISTDSRKDSTVNNVNHFLWMNLLNESRTNKSSWLWHILLHIIIAILNKIKLGNMNMFVDIYLWRLSTQCYRTNIPHNIHYPQLMKYQSTNIWNWRSFSFHNHKLSRGDKSCKNISHH